MKERCVLAVLVHARGEPVTSDVLMDRVWDGNPPRTAPETLHSYLSRLRGRLRGAAGHQALVERTSPGRYRLRVDPDRLDLLCFERLRADARAAAERGETERAVALLREAESLWRGEPLAEFSGAWAASARTRLVEDFRRVREERIRLELDLGRHADLIGELQEIAARNPLAQKTIGSLMLALYRCGRHDEALTLYRNTRRQLRHEQGIEPAAELRELHQGILGQDGKLAQTPPRSTPATAIKPPNNLPRDTRDFTGRKEQLEFLLREPASGADGPQALPLTVIHGMPGIGKTALAVHAAHRLSAAYPDGQLFLDLRGYSGQAPYDPAEALGVLLHACGAPAKLSDALDERVTRWREWTARRRMLVVLDNARDAAQVDPLLPGSGTCRALVTSRNRLAGLGSSRSLFLDVLSAAEAGELFTRIAGQDRLPADDAPLGRVVRACGCNPLALQLLASRFRHRYSWDLPHLLERLDRAADPLDELGDAVSSAFRVSYAELSEAARRTFRRLALNPGPDFDPRAALALAGAGAETSAADVRRSMEELLDGHLLTEPVCDRYRLHDLARAFGLQACAQAEPRSARDEALGRLLACYLDTAHRANRLAHPHHRALPARAGEKSPYAPEFAGADEASAWLTAERANLLAAARAAAAAAPSYAALFPHALAPSLKRWGAWEAADELFGAALTVLRDQGDREVHARTLVVRADLLAKRNKDEALRCAVKALALFQELHDAHGWADALLQTGRAHLAAGHGKMALRAVNQALTRYRSMSDRHGQAECLNVRGMALSLTGRYKEALRSVRSMLEVHRELGNVRGQAMAMNNMGEIARVQGDYAGAGEHYERSLSLMRRHGGRQELAILDTNLGAVYQAAGQTSRALACFQRALHSNRSAGDALGEVNGLIDIGSAYAETGCRGEALLHYGMAEKIAVSIGNAYERQRALLGAADVQRASGRLGVALELYERALGVAEGIGHPLGTAHALAGLARSTQALHRPERARGYAERAVGLYRELEADTEVRRLLPLLEGEGLTGS